MKRLTPISRRISSSSRFTRHLFQGPLETRVAVTAVGGIAILDYFCLIIINRQSVTATKPLTDPKKGKPCFPLSLSTICVLTAPRAPECAERALAGTEQPQSGCILGGRHPGKTLPTAQEQRQNDLEGLLLGLFSLAQRHFFPAFGCCFP